MKPEDIIYKSDKRSNTLANKQNLIAKLYKVKDNKVLYTVTSSMKNKQYIVTIQLLDLIKNKADSLERALDGNIKISCTCPGYLYHGYKYISYKKRVGIDKETRAPNITNPNQDGLACKHIITTLNQIKNDYTEIKNKLQLTQSDSQQKPILNITNNKSSNYYTELDTDIVSDFKSECIKLYDDFISFISSENSDDINEFFSSKYYNKENPINILQNLSKPALKFVLTIFSSKFKSLENLVEYINNKKSTFKTLLNVDIDSIIRKINSSINVTSESLINNIILNLIEEHYEVQ